MGTLEEFEEAFAAALASECATVIVVAADPEQISAAMYDHELPEEVDLTPEAIEIGQTGAEPGEPS